MEPTSSTSSANTPVSKAASPVRSVPVSSGDAGPKCDVNAIVKSLGSLGIAETKLNAKVDEGEELTVPAYPSVFLQVDFDVRKR